jgi:Flp pilus assembly protein TadD
LSGHHYWKISWCRAQFLCRQNRLTEAIEAAKQSVRLAPDCPDPLDMLAFIYSQAGDNERAAYTKQKAQAVYERQSALAKLE